MWEFSLGMKPGWDYKGGDERSLLPPLILYSLLWGAVPDFLSARGAGGDFGGIIVAAVLLGDASFVLSRRNARAADDRGFHERVHLRFSWHGGAAAHGRTTADARGIEH